MLNWRHNGFTMCLKLSQRSSALNLQRLHQETLPRNQDDRRGETKAMFQEILNCLAWIRLKRHGLVNTTAYFPAFGLTEVLSGDSRVFDTDGMFQVPSGSAPS